MFQVYVANGIFFLIIFHILSGIYIFYKKKKIDLKKFYVKYKFEKVIYIFFFYIFYFFLFIKPKHKIIIVHGPEDYGVTENIEFSSEEYMYRRSMSKRIEVYRLSM